LEVCVSKDGTKALSRYNSSFSQQSSKILREHNNQGEQKFMVKAIGRREFILTALATSVLPPRFLSGQAAPPPAANHARPEEVIRSLVTPNADFFIRNHFTTPAIREESWNLEVVGLVEKPLKLSYSDILLASAVQRPLTMECAGNLSGGRGVGTAVWSGIPMAELLKQASVHPSATTVILHGADSGGGDGVPAGTHFARAIPIDKAIDPATLLAYEMNGAPLPAEHGFPLRAMVCGWYGMDSVKWLTRIEISKELFQGYFQQDLYVAENSNGERRTITRMRINSKFLRPLDGEDISGKSYHIQGVAWAGENKISKVDLRFDGKGDWQPAVLGPSGASMVWTPWSFEWNIPRADHYSIEVRATDDSGNSQPQVRDPNRKDAYELNTPHRIAVNCRS
jgi:DMSO/TMAO reductase YedYZ molybdopterin-dependent catalytic subunit